MKVPYDNRNLSWLGEKVLPESNEWFIYQIWLVCRVASSTREGLSTNWVCLQIYRLLACQSLAGLSTRVFCLQRAGLQGLIHRPERFLCPSQFVCQGLIYYNGILQKIPWKIDLDIAVLWFRSIPSNFTPTSSYCLFNPFVPCSLFSVSVRAIKEMLSLYCEHNENGGVCSLL